MALDELSWIGADVRRSANALEWTVAGADSPLGPTDPDAQYWMNASEGLNVVKPGGDAESLGYAGAYAVAGAGISKHAPIRDRKSTRLNPVTIRSRMPSSA